MTTPRRPMERDSVLVKLAIAGDPGVGKTTLLAALTADVAEASPPTSPLSPGVPPAHGGTAFADRRRSSSQSAVGDPADDDAISLPRPPPLRSDVRIVRLDIDGQPSRVVFVDVAALPTASSRAARRTGPPGAAAIAALRSAGGAHVVLLVFDVTDRRTFDRLPWWAHELATALRTAPGRPATPVLLIGNRACATDTSVDDTGCPRAVHFAEASEFAAAHGFAYRELSAAYDDGFAVAAARDAALQLVASRAPWSAAVPPPVRPGAVRLPALSAPPQSSERPKGKASACWLW